MRVLVTGARGFVMSVFMRELLQATPDAQLLAVDLDKPDDLLLAFLKPYAERVEFATVDVRDAHGTQAIVDDFGPDVIVHGATITHVPEWEQADPVRFLDVNTLGTARILDAGRQAATVRRVVHVSSAAVYGAGTGDPGPLIEDAPLLPDEMYGVSKVASELVAARFASLYDIDVPIVRFTKVFGPMERPSSGRTAMSLPYHLAASLVSEQPLMTTERTLNATGDWISAVDLAAALIKLCTSTEPVGGTYNLASGLGTPVHELVGLSGATIQFATTSSTAFDMDPRRRFGKDAVYSIARAEQRLAWRPRPLAVQVQEYLNWARLNPDCFPTSDPPQNPIARR